MFQKTKYSTVLLLTALAAMFLLWPQAQPAYAATTINVTTTTDERTSPGTGCSLREAIQNFNDNAATYPECGTWSGAPVTINLPIPGTYQLLGAGADGANATGDLDITTNSGTLTIQGAGSGLTIISNQGAASDRVIQIDPGGITLILNDVTITNGNDFGGGGLNSVGATTNITVNRCIFRSNNTSGAGGAIEILDASLTINDSTFSSNTAVTGGAVEIRGTATLTVNNSTFSSNTATGNGGAIEIGGTATLTINNSTLTGNSSTNFGGAISLASGVTANIKNITVAGNTSSANGGGLHSNNTTALNIYNSIFANNTATGNNDCYLQAGTVTVNTKNLIMVGNCGTAASTANPGLGALASNGGNTQTMSIGVSSPAYNAGDNASCLPTDQRGTARPQFGTCDIGAFESAVAAAVGGVAQSITPRAGYPVAATAGMVAVSMMLMGAGAWLMRRG